MIKTAKTIKDFKADFKGYNILIPAGSTVSNNTARGPDDSYHFWVDFKEHAEKITGHKNSILNHDLTYYGINVPAEFCEPYL